MKIFLRTHVNAILFCLAILFLVLVVGYFVWGVGYIIMEFGQANTSNVAAAPAPSFDLQDAAQLDYRGIATLTVTSTASSTP